MFHETLSWWWTATAQVTWEKVAEKVGITTFSVLHAWRGRTSMTRTMAMHKGSSSTVERVKDKAKAETIDDLTQSVSSLTKSVATLTKTNEELVKEIKKLKGENKNRTTKPTGPVTKEGFKLNGYCWTCGYKVKGSHDRVGDFHPCSIPCLLPPAAPPGLPSAEPDISFLDLS